MLEIIVMLKNEAIFQVVLDGGSKSDGTLRSHFHQFCSVLYRHTGNYAFPEQSHARLSSPFSFPL